MADTTDVLGHQINVQGVAIMGTPSPSSVYNEFDSFGTMLGLPRLPEERNTAYKKRLLDVFARRASATYVGLLNGISRELGLEYYKPISIEVDASTPSHIQPVIEFLENKVYIWKDKSTNDLELELDRSTPGNNAYWLQDLVETINTESTHFNASINTGQEPVSRSDCIINQSNSKLVISFPLRDSPIQILQHTNIERQSLVFTDTRTFRTEVFNETELTSAGRYYVDYTNGIIKTFSVPNDGARVRYNYHEQSFEPVANPVILRDLQSEIFKEIMFLETNAPDGSTALGVPTELGATIINELMSVFPMYWGN